VRRGFGFYLNLVRQPGRVYARLARSQRVGGRVRTQVLVNLGRVTPPQVEALRRWVASNPLLPSAASGSLADLRSVRIRRSWSYGREALAHFLWWKLGLHRLVLESLNGVPGKARVERAIETMVLNRLCDPTSKYGLQEWLRGSATPFLLGYGDAPRYDNLFYRAMDRLYLRRDVLEPKVYRGVVRPLTDARTILYHDLTSTYCEREPNGLVQFGYSRDGVPGCPQVNWGMVVTPEGLPITSQVYAGNTKDETTVTGMRERLQGVFGLSGGLYVGDRGMRTTDIVADLVRHGFHYILAEKNSSSAAQEALALGQKVEGVAIGSANTAREVVTRDGARHIVLLNAQRRRELLEVLDHRQAQGRTILARWRNRVGKVYHHEILKGAQAELRSAGLDDLFDLGFDEDSLQGLTSEWKVRVERTKKWAGWWVLSTDTNLPTAEVAHLYQGLAIIEQGWKEIKGVLDVRPLHHRLDRRIAAHLMLCELAYLLERVIELKVREAGVSGPGGPLTGWGAVEEFRSMTANQLEVGSTGVKFSRTTEPTARQTEILRAAGLPEDAFRKGWTGLEV
jgi:Transposase DDE domain